MLSRDPYAFCYQCNEIRKGWYDEDGIAYCGCGDEFEHQPERHPDVIDRNQPNR